MSVAFRRESDEEHREPRFELPVPPGPNLVTKRGYDLIKTRTEELEAAVTSASSDEQLAELQRDLRYWRSRLATAQIAPQPHDGEVGIGSRVRFNLRGAEQQIHITGFDEADPTEGRIAFSAPLARALLGGSAGELVDFAGEEEAIEIIEVVTGSD